MNYLYIYVSANHPISSGQHWDPAILSPLGLTAPWVRSRSIRAMNAQITARHCPSKCALSLVPLRYLPAMPLCTYFLMDVLSL